MPCSGVSAGWHLVRVCLSVLLGVEGLERNRTTVAWGMKLEGLNCKGRLQACVLTYLNPTPTSTLPRVLKGLGTPQPTLETQGGGGANAATRSPPGSPPTGQGARLPAIASSAESASRAPAR